MSAVRSSHRGIAAPGSKPVLNPGFALGAPCSDASMSAALDGLQLYLTLLPPDILAFIDGMVRRTAWLYGGMLAPVDTRIQQRHLDPQRTQYIVLRSGERVWITTFYEPTSREEDSWVLHLPFLVLPLANRSLLFENSGLRYYIVTDKLKTNGALSLLDGYFL